MVPFHLRSHWPKPETVSQWLLNALQNHTSIPPINKRTCVRIQYKSLPGNSDIAYHVDLPIYCQYSNLLGIKKTRIGLNGEIQWEQKSDPIKFSKWFFENCQKNKNDKNQLGRVVQYIKAWKDFVKNDNKFPSGMALTVLLAENYYPHQRDDIAFKETIRQAYNSLYNSIFFFNNEITSPVEPYNDLLSRLTPIQKKYFKNSFETLVDNAKNAVDESSYEIAIGIWRKQFGNRILN